jgi:hypothetical protein
MRAWFHRRQCCWQDMLGVFAELETTFGANASRKAARRPRLLSVRLDPVLGQTPRELDDTFFRAPQVLGTASERSV